MAVWTCSSKGEMMEWIKRYWIEAVFGAVIAALGGAYRKIAKRLKARQTEDEAIKDGLLAILHDRLYTECSRHIDAGQIDLTAMKNIEYIYKAYHALGGNGTGTELYERVKALDLEKEEHR